MPTRHAGAEPRSSLFRYSEALGPDPSHEAYLVAGAESTGVGQVASFDQTVDRVGTITRIAPPEV